MTRVIRLTVAVVLGLSALFAASPAGAHSLEDSYLYLDVSDTSLGGRIEMPVPDVAEILDVELSTSGDALVAEITDRRDAVQTYIVENISIGANGEQWPLQFTDIGLLANNEDADGNYVLFFFTVDAPAEIPRQLDITFELFFDELAGRGGLVLIANDWKGGVVDNYEEFLAAFAPDQRTATIDLGSASQWTNFTTSIELGIDHIKTGPDHVLFVLVLMLPAVLVFRSTWVPAASFGNALWRILKIVTMFTVAHSITFVLAGLDWLPLPPSKLVETVIAASIAAAALHNLRPVLPNREAALAFGFGLIHGMGFASLVSGLDVSTTTQLVSLLGRNLGIEIGQAVVVLITFPALFWLRRTPVYRPVFVLGSVGLAIVSMGWMVERVFETDLRINKIVDVFTVWPRSLYLAIVAAVLAAAVQRYFDGRGELLDTDPGETDASATPEPIGAPQ